MRILHKVFASAGMLALSAAVAVGVKRLFGAQKRAQADVDEKFGNVDEEGMDVVQEEPEDSPVTVENDGDGH